MQYYALQCKGQNKGHQMVTLKFRVKMTLTEIVTLRLRVKMTLTPKPSRDPQIQGQNDP